MDAAPALPVERETPTRPPTNRGRGRGSRRGRGRRRLSLQDVARQQQERRQERQQRIRVMIDNLENNQVRDLLCRVAERQPALVADIWGEQPPAEGPPLQEQPQWCTCGRCRAMATAEEEVCCEGGQDSCITLQQEFHALVLDPMVLDLARIQRYDMLGRQENRDPNKNTRHTAYRQFILWQHGRLGRRNRRVVPSCAVLSIRREYPDERGQYVGFIPTRLL